MKRAARETYFEKLEENITNIKSSNSKMSWQIMNSLIKGNKTNESLPPLKINNTNSFAFSDCDKSELLNSYFRSVF